MKMWISGFSHDCSLDKEGQSCYMSSFRVVLYVSFKPTCTHTSAVPQISFSDKEKLCVFLFVFFPLCLRITLHVVGV